MRTVLVEYDDGRRELVTLEPGDRIDSLGVERVTDVTGEV